MLAKLQKAFGQMKAELSDLRADVERLGIRPVVKDGKDGLPGPAGNDGKDGEPGEQGPRGETGERGRDGRDGAPGAAGVQGPRGQTGEQGQPGPAGPRGPQGPKGDKGERGLRGEPGPQGQQGEPGKDGASITRVDIQKGVLSVWIDGQKQEVGRVGNGTQVPSSFTPLARAVKSAGGGGHGDRHPEDKDPTVYVEKQSDFPDQDENFIYLRATCIYQIIADVTVTKPFIGENGSLITAGNLDSFTLTYLGAGNMFAANDAHFAIRQITIDCPNAQAFASTDTVGAVKRFICDNVAILRCAKVGTFEGLSLTQFNNSGAFAANDGVSLVGTAGTTFSVSQLAMITASDTFVGIDYGSSQFTFANEVSNFICVGVPGGIGVSGLADSGNIPVGRLGMLSNSEFIGLTATNNILSTDLRWSISNSPPLADTQPGVLLSMNGNATPTDITAVNTPVKVEGTWVVESSIHFESDTTGRVTYKGERPITVPVSMVFTSTVGGGGGDQATYYVAKGSGAGSPSIIPNSAANAEHQIAEPVRTTLVWRVTFNTDDFIEPFVENNDDASDVTVSSATQLLN